MTAVEKIQKLLAEARHQRDLAEAALSPDKKKEHNLEAEKLERHALEIDAALDMKIGR